MTLSIIIISYNSANLLKKCFTAIRKNKVNFDYEIIVVDNASQDKSIDIVKKNFQKVRLIVNQKNLGFAKAANQAVKKSRGHYLFLLNPDTIISKDTLKTMINFMEKNPSAAAATCQLLNPDGSIQYNTRTFPTIFAVIFRFLKLEKLFLPRFYRKYLMLDFDHKNIKAIDWATGAFLMLNRKAIKDVGFFDERFFLYNEDVDWCYRAHQRGWKIFYTPETQAIHLYQRQSAKGVINIHTLIHLKSMSCYFLKRAKEKFSYLKIKKFLDPIFGLLLSIIFSPFMLLIALAIRLETKGNVLFKQKRLGKDGKVFVLYKFRTMFQNAEHLQKKLKKLNVADQILFKIPHDPRLTKIGSFLRSSGLDELPQFFNVIKGEMSLIGPRPLAVQDIDYKIIKKNNPLKQLWDKRGRIFPGITGYWQAYAFNQLNFKEMLRCDSYYIDHLSFGLDIKIVFKTIMTKSREVFYRSFH